MPNHPTRQLALLQAKYDCLLRNVRKMREYEKSAYLSNDQADKDHAKIYRRHVDAIIKSEQPEPAPLQLFCK